ncbi:hypothetical protein [Halomonas alimentaria]|uniref:Bacteriophage protein n=1 Tax=Halomonas alimentaria TaxID=147248 RepID=A0A7X4W2R4_9GAMM|nr:hypothetical protein [Halomonas alimentaria]NAW33239.1 hypothetical protein [Halomonas alimentaria]
MATTKNRNTPTRIGFRRSAPVAADAVCHAGAIAVLNATGYAAPATTATGLTALGVFHHYQDNTGGADGDQVVEIERGFFHFANSAGADEITRAAIGSVCYLVDDETVAATDGTASRSPAGIVDDVDEHGVWVCIDPTNGVAASA